MAQYPLTVDLAEGPDSGVRIGEIRIGRVDYGSLGTSLVVPDEKIIPVGAVPPTLLLEAGVAYRVREVRPKGQGVRYFVMPSAPTLYRDLTFLGPLSPGPFPTPSELTDDLIAALGSTLLSQTAAATDYVQVADTTGTVTVLPANAAAAGFVLAANWTMTGSVFYRKQGKTVSMTFTGCQYTGIGITVPATGDIANIDVFSSIPATLRPALVASLQSTGGGRMASFALTSGGVLSLAAVSGTGNISTGNGFSLSGTWLTA